jgi:hypothetical protein
MEPWEIHGRNIQLRFEIGPYACSRSTFTSASVGSTGDSYDNAMTETIIGLFKTEIIHARGP